MPKDRNLQRLPFRLPQGFTRQAGEEVLLGGAGDSSSVGDAPALTVDVSLSGSGGAAATAAGTVSTTKDLSSSGNAASTGFADLSEATLIAGSGKASGEGSGNLDANVSLVADGHAAADAFAALEETTELTGSGDAAADADAALSFIAGLEGSGTAAADAFTSLDEESILFGQGHASGEAVSTLDVQKELTGSGDAAADTSAFMESGGELAADGQAAADTQANINATFDLSSGVLTGESRYLDFPDVVGTLVSTPEYNELLADDAHHYQSIGSGSGYGGASISWDQTKGHFSGKSVQVDNSVGQASGWRGGFIPALEEEQITVVAYIYHEEGGNEDFTPFVAWAESDNSTIGFSSGSTVTVPDSTWTKVTHTATLPTNGTIGQAHSYFRFEDNATSKTFWITAESTHHGSRDTFIPSNRVEGKLRIEGKFALNDYSHGVSYQRIFERQAGLSGYLQYFDYELPDAYQTIGSYDGTVQHLRNGPRPGAPVLTFTDGQKYVTGTTVEPSTGDWGFERPPGSVYFSDTFAETWTTDYIVTPTEVGDETDGKVYWYKVYDDDLLVEHFNASDIAGPTGTITADWTDEFGKTWSVTGTVTLGDDLSGVGSASPTASMSVTRTVTSQGVSSSWGQASMEEHTLLSGSGDAALDQTAQLSAIVAFSGSGNSASAATGDLLSGGELAGSGKASGEGFGNLSALYSFTSSGNAASEGSADLTEHTFVSGSGDASSEASAILGAIQPASGSGNAASEAFASMDEATLLSGTGDAASFSSCELSRTLQIAGAGDASSAGTSSVARARGFVSSGDSASEATASLDEATLLSGSGSNSSASSAQLGLLVEMSGSGKASGEVTADLSLWLCTGGDQGVGLSAPPFAPPIGGEGSYICVPKPVDELSSTGPNASEASANLVVTKEFVSQGNAASEASASLGGATILASSGNASSEGSGTMSPQRAFTSSGNAAAEQFSNIEGALAISLGLSIGEATSVGAAAMNVEYSMTVVVDVSISVIANAEVVGGTSVPIYASNGGTFSSKGGNGMNRNRRLPKSRLVERVR